MKYIVAIFLLCFSISVYSQSPKRIYTAAENARILHLLDSTHGELVKLVTILEDPQFFHHIDTLTWSANDIVEHLGLIDEGYVRELWFSLAQPKMPENYLDSTKGGDEKAMAYATQPEKGKARGTNLPLNRYCDKQTCLRIFSSANELAKEFFTVNGSKDLRRYFVFRISGNGTRTVRDAYQLGLLLVAHRIRHIDQLKRVMADSRFKN